MFAIVAVLFPATAFALEMPTSGNDLASMEGVGAQAYLVADANTGEVLISKNPDMVWPPASLTKLVTALVVLDTKPKLSKTVAMTQQDQVAGWCSLGGVCVKSKAGVKFTVEGLFYAALLPSANNAANALARSTGLSTDEFVARMNKKAADLGATNTHFNEPTGMDPNNQITAADYSLILRAAMSNSYLRKVAATQQYTLKSTNNAAYSQVIKNNDKLLADGDIQMIGAKTGYLDESQYNFASMLETRGGQKLAVVVLGEPHLYVAFDETKQLAELADQTKLLSLFHFGGQVAGTSTSASTVVSMGPGLLHYPGM